jgi:catechol 2,3-dioxygenase-like lactoylglutathione lyase family enzyme
LPSYKPVQIAYFVSDIREAAKKMSAMTGAGPFFVIDNIELEWGEHRDSPCDFVHSSAYGQWGGMMMELVQQESEGPSPFRDLYAPGEEGIHHVACLVDSVEATIKEYDQLGYPLAARAKAKVGTEFAFIDTSKVLGHMIEVYVGDEMLTGFYSLVKEASVGWDGREIFRSL